MQPLAVPAKDNFHLKIPLDDFWCRLCMKMLFVQVYSGRRKMLLAHSQ